MPKYTDDEYRAIGRRFYNVPGEVEIVEGEVTFQNGRPWLRRLWRRLLALTRRGGRRSFPG